MLKSVNDKNVQGCIGSFKMNDNRMRIEEKKYQIVSGCAEPKECTKGKYVTFV